MCYDHLYTPGMALRVMEQLLKRPFVIESRLLVLNHQLRHGRWGGRHLPVVPHRSTIICSLIRRWGRCSSRFGIPVNPPPPTPLLLQQTGKKSGFFTDGAREEWVVAGGWVVGGCSRADDVPHPARSEEHSTGLLRSPVIKRDHLPANRDPHHVLSKPG